MDVWDELSKHPLRWSSVHLSDSFLLSSPLLPNITQPLSLILIQPLQSQSLWLDLCKWVNHTRDKSTSTVHWFMSTVFLVVCVRLKLFCFLFRTSTRWKIKNINSMTLCSSCITSSLCCSLCSVNVCVWGPLKPWSWTGAQRVSTVQRSHPGLRVQY